MKKDCDTYDVQMLDEQSKSLTLEAYKLKKLGKISESTKLLQSVIQTDWMSFNMGDASAAFALYRWFTKSFGAMKTDLDIAYIFLGVAQKAGYEKAQNESFPQHTFDRLKTQINDTYYRFKLAHKLIGDREMDREHISMLLLKYYVTVTLPNGQSLAEAVFTTIYPNTGNDFQNDVQQFDPETIIYYCLQETTPRFIPTTKEDLLELTSDSYGIQISSTQHNHHQQQHHHQKANEHTKLTGDDDGCFSHCTIL